MPTEWNEYMYEVWESRKQLKALLKEMKDPIKQHDVRAIRNHIAWAKATLDSMKAMCAYYEAKND